MKKLIKKSFVAILLVFSYAVPLSAQTSTTQTSVALDGYCPVAYHAMNMAAKGDPKYSSTYKGATYYFMNENAKKMFDASPDQYLPAYGGYCATAMSMGQKLKSDPQLFSIYNGKTYLFSTKMAKDNFDKDPAMYVSKADAEFAKLK